MLFSVIKNVNIFRVMQELIRRTLTVCFVTVRCMHLGDKCGGNFRMTEKGIKDCTNCQLPHKAQNYGYVTGKYSELAELMKKMREAEKDTQE